MSETSRVTGLRVGQHFLGGPLAGTHSAVDGGVGHGRGLAAGPVDAAAWRAEDMAVLREDPGRQMGGRAAACPLFLGPVVVYIVDGRPGLRPEALAVRVEHDRAPLAL